MKVKKYVASTLQEAMSKVRGELGRDAIILHTHKVQVGGFWGFFGKTMVEVTAATDDDRGSAPPPLAAEEAASALANPAGALAASQAALPNLQALQEEINSVKAMMNQVMRRIETPDSVSRLPEGLRAVYDLMIRSEVDPDLAAELIGQVAAEHPRPDIDPDLARQAAERLIGERLGAPRGVEILGRKRKVIALVGPTGVGKTTTLAKLAAGFALGQKRDVALVTADTYRIAAVEQLRTYGEIIGVPVDVVFTPQELKAALAKHEGRDLILIDTAGRSHKNLMQMSELKSILEAARADETHLVLSLTTNGREAVEMARTFAAVGFDRLLLTKIDECSSPGLVLNLSAQVQKPLSYMTTGQNVPDDIELANPGKIAKSILGG